MFSGKSVIVCAAVVSCGAVGVQAAALNVYGAPGYDANTGTGYPQPSNTFAGGSVSNSGVAVGSADWQVSGSGKGARAIRWDANGFVELTGLGTDVNGLTDIQASAINVNNVTAGIAQKYDNGTYKGYRAMRWAADGTAVELSNLGTDANGWAFNTAAAINSASQVVGGADKYDNGVLKGTRAVRWNSGGAITELTSINPGYTGEFNSSARSINDNGTAVGNSSKYVGVNDKGSRAVRWDSSNNVAELGTLGDTSGTTYGGAYFVNNNDVAAGYMEKYVSGFDKGIRAVTWGADNSALELGDLGTNGGYTNSEAYALDDSGTAVGYAMKYVAGDNKGTRAARWAANGVVTELGNLGEDTLGVTTSYAYAINSGGITVGYAEKYVANTLVGERAVYWGSDGVAVDINSLIDSNSGWTLNRAYAISDTGWISGTGMFDPDGVGGMDAYERFYLVQVPEPGGLTLLGVGAAALMMRRSRRQA